MLLLDYTKCTLYYNDYRYFSAVLWPSTFHVECFPSGRRGRWWQYWQTPTTLSPSSTSLQSQSAARDSTWWSAPWTSSSWSSSSLRQLRGLCRRTWMSGFGRDAKRGQVNTSQVLSANSWRKSSTWERTKVSLMCWKPFLFQLLMLPGQWRPMQSGESCKSSCNTHFNSGIILLYAMTRNWGRT